MLKILIEADGLVVPEILEDAEGFYFLVDGLRMSVPPGRGGHHLLEDPVFNFMVGSITGVALNILSNYLYDLLKNQKVKTVKVNGVKLSGNKKDIKKLIKLLANEKSKK